MSERFCHLTSASGRDFFLVLPSYCSLVVLGISRKVIWAWDCWGDRFTKKKDVTEDSRQTIWIHLDPLRLIEFD